jgi:hypothetical protein
MAHPARNVRPQTSKEFTDAITFELWLSLSSEHALKTQIRRVIATYVRIAILKKETPIQRLALHLSTVSLRLRV